MRCSSYCCAKSPPAGNTSSKAGQDKQYCDVLLSFRYLHADIIYLAFFFFLFYFWSCGRGWEMLLLWLLCWPRCSPGAWSLGQHGWLAVGCLPAHARALSSLCSQQGCMHLVNTKAMLCGVFSLSYSWEASRRLEREDVEWLLTK